MTTPITDECPRAISGTPIVTNAGWSREFVMVSQPVWEHYDARWREINSEWWGAGTNGWTLDVLSAAMLGIREARKALLAEIRIYAKTCSGPYLIPV